MIVFWLNYYSILAFEICITLATCWRVYATYSIINKVGSRSTLVGLVYKSGELISDYLPEAGSPCFRFTVLWVCFANIRMGISKLIILSRTIVVIALLNIIFSRVIVYLLIYKIKTKSPLTALFCKMLRIFSLLIYFFADNCNDSYLTSSISLPYRKLKYFQKNRRLPDQPQIVKYSYLPFYFGHQRNESKDRNRDGKQRGDFFRYHCCG